MQQDTIFDPNPYGVSLNETLSPQYLKQQGYKTHGVGKVLYAFHFLTVKLMSCHKFTFNEERSLNWLTPERFTQIFVFQNI